ncbi:2-amino-4-hydroxy-6-hydroxymethyldihydropteridine diphosphokinase [Donghicola sp. XS_ASV15]|uniref:2-amino-4-hydroxy-6- hydroxymethyldihydropteridine diphosphokinase n=1 Tax=Donghicola sp. XS_ASV15 TaxID=3241295 RepID=UPI003512BF1D
MKKYNQVIFSLGGNQEPDVKKSIELQVKVASILRQSHIFPVSVSKFYLTPAFPAGIGADFVNSAIIAKTTLSAQQVLQTCHQIEAEFGRERVIRWGERVIDIDLISFADLVLPDVKTYEKWRNLAPEAQRVDAPEQLILPHPRVQDRAFVLVPLCDIAPEWVHPVLKQSARALCAALPASEVDTVRAIDGTRVVNYPEPV